MARQFVSASSQNIDCGDIAALKSASAFTITASVKRSALNAFCGVGKYKSSTDALYISFWSDGYLYAVVRNGSGNSIKLASNTTNWLHVTLVFDGSEVGNDRIKVYFDGALQSPTHSGTHPTSTSSSSSSFLLGDIGIQKSDASQAEVKIFKRALNAGEILHEYNSGNLYADGGYWPLPGYSPETDLSGNGNNGTLVNSPAIVDHPWNTYLWDDDDYEDYELAAGGGGGVSPLINKSLIDTHLINGSLVS